MAPVIPKCEPDNFMAGDTVEWEKSLDSYSPAEGYALSYAITGPTIIDGSQLQVVPNPAGGSDWLVTIPGSLTAIVKPGTYNWTAFATLASVRNVADEGVFTIRANAANVKTGVTSHAAQMVTVLECEIQARVTGNGSANDSYSINGRSIAKMKMAELVQLRDRYQVELWRERNPSRAAPSRAVRFGWAG